MASGPRAMAARPDASTTATISGAGLSTEQSCWIAAQRGAASAKPHGVGGIVGGPGVGADLARRHQLLEGVDQVEGGGQRGIGDVELVEVEVVGAEAAQAALDGGAQVGRGGILAGGLAGGLVEGVAPLGGDHHLVAAVREGPAEDLLTVPRTVVGGGVEEGRAQVEGAVERCGRLVVVHRTPAELPAPSVQRAADGPAAHAYRADLDAGPSQGTVHGHSPGPIWICAWYQAIFSAKCCCWRRSWAMVSSTRAA